MNRKHIFNDIAQEQKLISLIQEKPAIWNKTHLQHKNSFVLAKAWDEVAAAVGFSKITVRNKWKALVKRLRQEVSSNPTLLSGSGGQSHGSKWHHFDAMSFLLSSILPNKSTGNISALINQEKSDDWLSDSSGDIEDEMKENQRAYNALVNQVACSTANKKRATKTDQMLQVENEKLSLIKKAVEQNNSNLTSTDDMLFYRTLMPYINTLGPEEKLSLRQDVSSLVDQYVFNKELPALTVLKRAPVSPVSTARAASVQAYKRIKDDSDDECSIVDWRKLTRKEIEEFEKEKAKRFKRKDVIKTEPGSLEPLPRIKMEKVELVVIDDSTEDTAVKLESTANASPARNNLREVPLHRNQFLQHNYSAHNPYNAFEAHSNFMYMNLQVPSTSSSTMPSRNVHEKDEALNLSVVDRD